ncbi:MAG: sulfate transporter [Chelatococcus sp.]|nr:MAG: sulfate transporter [Chelatococcus sp.]
MALADDILDEKAAVSAGIVEVGADKFMRDPKGNLIGLGQIKPQRLLEDEMVRKVMRFATDLSAQIARFKGHTFEDLAAFQSLLEQQYGAKAGGPKGNVTFSTFDDSMRVEVKIADQIAFGPELQAAKRLVDECLKEWGADSHEALRSLVNRVFSVEKEGQINRGELFSLLAMEIEDKRWQSAMDAIRDSIRVIGTKAYLRFRVRDEQGALSTVTIDLAAA